MKKDQIKLFIVSLFLIIFMPLTVNATSVSNFKLTCDNSMKKNSIMVCKVNADVVGGNISEIDFDITYDTSYLTIHKDDVNPATMTVENIAAGNNVTVLTLNVPSKSKAGSSEIKINNISGIDTDNNSLTITPVTLTKQVKVLDDNNKLSDLKVDGVTVANFSPTTYNYPYAAKSSEINIVATKASSSATVSGAGKKALKCGSNVVSVAVTAESGDKQNYNIQVVRECKNDTTLKNITLSSGTLDPAFDKDTKTYVVNVSKDIDKISITGTKNDDTQVITGELNDKALKYGANKFEIKVKAEDETEATYVITVNREDGRSSNNNLASVTLSDGKLAFDKTVLEYTVKVLNAVTNITVNPTLEDVTAKFEVIGGKDLKLGDNIITIKVTAENEAVKEYKITVKRLDVGETIGDNPNIKELTVENYNISFNQDKNNYVLKIDDEKKLNIKIVMEDETATYFVEGNEKLKNGSVITITTRSEDGTTKIYKIVIEKKSNLALFIIIGLVALGVCLGIIAIIIKTSKKDKDNDKEEDKKDVTINVVKENPYKKEDELKEVIKEEITFEKTSSPDEIVRRRVLPEEDIVEVLDDTPVKPLIIDLMSEAPSKPYERRITTIIEPTKKEEPKKGPYSLDEVLDRSYRTTNNDEESDETKICSICGHRVAKSLKTCPYCKRSW